MRRAYLAPSRKLRVIGWGAPIPDETVLAKGRNRRQADSGEELEARTLTLLCVGRLGRHKGQLWLLDVYRQARSQFRRPVRLVLVGRDEGDAAAVNTFIADRGLQSEVTVTGEVSDGELAELYAEADIFTLFSHYEAFGLVYFEAMAHGAPVLTHDVGANRELLGRGAVVVPRYDREAAGREMVRLVNDDLFRLQLSTDAQEYTLSEFTWPAVAEKYLEVYQKA